MLKSTSLI